MRTFSISGDPVLGNGTCTGLVSIFTIDYKPTLKQFKELLNEAYPKERIRRINYVTEFDGGGKFVRHRNYRKIPKFSR